MLARTQEANRALAESERSLERKVEERTRQLQGELEVAAALGSNVQRVVWRRALATLGVRPVPGLEERLYDRGLARPRARPDLGFELVQAGLRETLLRGASQAGRFEALNRACAQAQDLEEASTGCAGGVEAGLIDSWHGLRSSLS